MSDGAPMLFEHGTLSGSHLAFEEPLRFLTCGLAHNGSALGVQLGFRSVIVSAMRTLCFGPDGCSSSEVHGFASFMFNGEAVQGTLLEPFPDAIPEPLRLGFQEFLEWSYDGIVLPFIENRFGSISNYQRWRNTFPDCRTFDDLYLAAVAANQERLRKQQQEHHAKQQEQEAKQREASEARLREQIEADRLHEASQARLRKQQQAQEAKLEAKLNFGFFEEEKAKRRQQVEREEKERQSVAAQRKATERKAAAEAKKAAKAAETEAFRLKHVKEQ